MVFVGMDLHQKETQLCVISDAGQVLDEARIPTSPASLQDFFRRLGKFRVLLEASTDSQWAAPRLRALPTCEEVVVADPGYEGMYGRKGRTRQKTDKRDAFALATALMERRYSKTHEASEASRKTRLEVAARRALVAQRTMLVNQVQSAMKAAELLLRIPGDRSTFSKAIRKSDALPQSFKEEVEPLLAVLDALQVGINAYDARFEEKAKAPIAKRMQTVPGIGVVTAVAFAAVLDDLKRFESSKHVAAYVGLVPKAHGSGESDGRMGGITRAGDPYMRALLVQAAMSLMRGKSEEGAGLRQWAGRLRAKSGTAVAAVALARRLARIAYVCARTETDFNPSMCERRNKRRSSQQPLADATAS